MTIRNLDRRSFRSTVAEGGVVIVDWTASSCGACATFDPIFARVAKRYPDLIFGRIDTEKEADLVSELAISHIPCLIIYRNEFLLFKQSGNFSESQLEELISTAVSLDMERLRASVAGDQAQKAPAGNGGG
jgi:thiol-disulfide isomerase/thioredoxin